MIKFSTAENAENAKKTYYLLLVQKIFNAKGAKKTKVVLHDESAAADKEGKGHQESINC